MTWLSALAVGMASIATGVGTALYATSYSGTRADIRNGAWEFYRGVGEQDRGIYRRAFIARIAWFGLPATETVYGTAHTDDHGDPLSNSCRYRIHGGAIDARWWSVTAYRDRHWMPNALDRYGISSTTAHIQPDGTWSILLGRTPEVGDWLPLDGRTGELALIFRVYNPSERLRAELGTTMQLPHIRKVSC